jgi:hypothetical protein
MNNGLYGIVTSLFCSHSEESEAIHGGATKNPHTDQTPFAGRTYFNPPPFDTCVSGHPLYQGGYFLSLYFFFLMTISTVPLIRGKEFSYEKIQGVYKFVYPLLLLRLPRHFAARNDNFMMIILEKKKRHSSESWNLTIRYLQTKILDQVRNDAEKNDRVNKGL